MGNLLKKRATKNVVTVVIIAALAVGMAFTTGLVGGSAQPQMSDGQQSQQQMQPPDMQNNDNGSGDNGSSDQNGQPPEPPDGQNGNSANSDGNTNQNGQPPEPPDGQNGPSDQQGGISTGMKVLTGAEALAIAMLIVYLIMSGGNKKTIRETMPNKKKIATFVIATVLAGGALGAAGIVIPEKTNAGEQTQQTTQQAESGEQPQMQQNTQQVEATGAATVDGEEKTLNDTYESETADENAVLVTNGGTLTSDGATINKKSGDGSNTDSCDFHGVNAGLLVNENSTATVKNATIKTAANRSNAVFCTGEQSKIEISDSTIETTGQSSCRGLDATNGGTIIADNMKIITQGGSCATLATDRGEGTVTVTNSELETNGAGSPIIYSTGDISIENTKGTANGSQITVVEGKNTATITKSEVTASAAGNRGDVDVCGVMLYQSMSGDADEGTSEFKAVDSTLSIDKDSDYYKTAPMFFVTNTDSVINLTNTELNFGSRTLLSVKGTSEWGNEGSNGGTVTLNATDQNLEGDVEVDDISEATISLTKGSTYKGTINGDNTAKSITLKLSTDSKIVLTGDSYVSALEDEESDYSNIDFNGHKLYVNGKAIN